MIWYEPPILIICMYIQIIDMQCNWKYIETQLRCLKSRRSIRSVYSLCIKFSEIVGVGVPKRNWKGCSYIRVSVTLFSSYPHKEFHPASHRHVFLLHHQTLTKTWSVFCISCRLLHAPTTTFCNWSLKLTNKGICSLRLPQSPTLLNTQKIGRKG